MQHSSLSHGQSNENTPESLLLSVPLYLQISNISILVQAIFSAQRLE